MEKAARTVDLKLAKLKATGMEGSDVAPSVLKF